MIFGRRSITFKNLRKESHNKALLWVQKAEYDKLLKYLFCTESVICFTRRQTKYHTKSCKYLDRKIMLSDEADILNAKPVGKIAYGVKSMLRI